MRYLKTFETKTQDIDDLKRLINDFKRLLSHFNYFFEEIGYDFKGFIDRGNWISEYFKDNEYMFSLTVNSNSILIFQESLANAGDEEVHFIGEYLKTLNGLIVSKENDNKSYSAFKKIVFDVIGDVDDIIKQITFDDFLLKHDTIKYNL